MKKLRIYIAILTSALVLGATSVEAQTARKKGTSKKAKGAVIGGVGGAVTGRVLAGKRGGTRAAVLGGAAGAAAGGAIGRKKDRKTDPARYEQYTKKD